MAMAEEIIQIPFKLPAEISHGLAVGTLFRRGQKIHSAATGKIVMQLDEATGASEMAQQGANALAREARARLKIVGQKSTEVSKLVANATKTHPVAAAVVGLGAVATATAGYFYVKSSRNADEAKVITAGETELEVGQTEAVREVARAATAWVQAVEEGGMTEQVATDFANAIIAFKDVVGESCAGDMVTGDDAEFAKMVADYTAQFTHANGVTLELPATPSNVVELAPFLEAQRQVFAKRDREAGNG